MNTASEATTNELANELDRVLVLEMVRVTEKAAIAASRRVEELLPESERLAIEGKANDP